MRKAFGARGVAILLQFLVSGEVSAGAGARTCCYSWRGRRKASRRRPRAHAANFGDRVMYTLILDIREKNAAIARFQFDTVWRISGSQPFFVTTCLACSRRLSQLRRKTDIACEITSF